MEMLDKAVIPHQMIDAIPSVLLYDIAIVYRLKWSRNTGWSSRKVTINELSK